ncbi:MAG: PqqD family protein [Clostridia bacterium]|nr:PqqD family protein [Clostridia bacterium]
MKIKEGYMLRKVAGKYIVVPVGEEAVDFNGLITTNETGAFLWKALENEISEEKLLSEFLAEYDIDEQTAASDLSDFISKLNKAELIV